jgi:beta-lactam-binding protein with PASTA domain
MRRSSLLAVVGVVALAGCGNHSRSVVVPKINTARLDLALQRLHDAGLRATFGKAHMPCGDTALPKVNHQRPRPGTRVRAGTAVTFRFGYGLIPSGGGSGGWVHVPRLVGKDERAISKTMTHVPIWTCVQVRAATDVDASGVVLVRQDPAPGTRVHANGVLKDHSWHPSTVTLYYEARS